MRAPSLPTRTRSVTDRSTLSQNGTGATIGRGAEVRVNGVLLGPEPTPLMHGDKVEVAGLELRFADETKRGLTQYTSLDAIPEPGGARRTGAARAVAPSTALRTCGRSSRTCARS